MIMWAFSPVARVNMPGTLRRAPLVIKCGLSTSTSTLRAMAEPSSTPPQEFAMPPIPRNLKSLVMNHLSVLERTDEKPRDAIKFFSRWYSETNEDTVRLLMFNKTVIVTRDIDIVRQILGKKSAAFTNGNSFRKSFGSLFPNSVIVVEGEPWKRIRGIITRAMYRLDQSGLVNATATTCERSVASWGCEPREVELVSHFTAISFDAFHKTAYGIDFRTVSGENLELLRASRGISEALGERTMGQPPILWKIPTKKNRQLATNLGIVRDLMQQFVLKEQSLHTAKVDAGEEMDSKSFSLLEAIVHASLEESKNSLSMGELIDNVGSINFGAFDTTSNTMSLLLVSLARNPVVQERLYNHVKHIDLHTITLDDLQANDYLINTINEQNRFLPIAPMVPRDAIEDVVLDNNKLIKKGTGVLLHGYAMGRDPLLWDGAQDLDEFKPERWSTFTPSKLAHIPFGFGGRMCPGKAIAMNNLATIVTFFVQRFRVEETDTPVKLASHVGIGVRKSDRLRFIPR